MNWFMDSKIIILGEPKEDELEFLRLRSAANGISVQVYQNISQFSLNDPSEVSAIFSFLPDDINCLQDLFAALPIGSSKFIPLFQIVDKNISQELRDMPIYSFIKRPLDYTDIDNAVRVLVKNSDMVLEHKNLMAEVVKYRRQKQQLLKLGTALSFNHDLNDLLTLILSESMEMVKADAASIYIRERTGPGKRLTNTLRFKVAMNNSVELKKIKEFTINIDKNRIAGYVAETAKTLNIDDVYNLKSDVPYYYNSDFDKTIGYHIKSMVTIPLKNIDDIVVGVIQLINKKRDFNTKLISDEVVKKEVMPFTYSDEEFLQSIASLAAVSIERTQLYEDIENIFEGFLESSAAAIDERDKVTSGHSKRVMGYAVAFAKAVNMDTVGVYKNISFGKKRMKQFKFAALLHDIGKIGVPEALLNKENRLDPGAMEALKTRFEREKTRIMFLPEEDVDGWHSNDELEKDLEFLEEVNKLGFIDDEKYLNLKRLTKKNFFTSQGLKEPVIRPQEFEALSVRKGNLTSEERKLINSHAAATRRILSKVPWTDDMKDLPVIACLHHEKLDGSGYPDGLFEDEIPFESKILAVIDIFDALVAQDRPYKPAMPMDKALSILRAEAEAGHIDRDIVEFFISENIFNLFNENSEAFIAD